MESVQEHISEHGFEPVFIAIHEFKKGNRSFHSYALENEDISLDDWFEFGWMLNSIFGGHRGDFIPLVDFNYVQLETDIETFVEENAPVSTADIVNEVVETQENLTMEDVAEWVGIANIVENEEGEIVSLTY